MSGVHPSEEIVQQYAVDRPGCTAEQVAHIAGCPECQAAVAAYVTVAEVLRKRPAPAFDFDLGHSANLSTQGCHQLSPIQIEARVPEYFPRPQIVQRLACESHPELMAVTYLPQSPQLVGIFPD